MKDTPRRILVAQTLYLGDVILSLPLIRQLKSLYPDAEVDVLVRKETASVLLNQPWISSTVLYDKSEVHRGLRGLLTLAREIRSHHYDLALVLPGSIRTVLAVYLARIPRRIGTDQSTGIDLHLGRVTFPKAAWFIPGGMVIRLMGQLYRLFGGRGSITSAMFTDTIMLDSSASALRRDCQLLDVLRPAVGEQVGYERLRPGEQEEQSVQDLLANAGARNKKIVAVAPGSHWRTKRWSPKNFSLVIRELVERGFGVVLFGGEADRGVCDSVMSLVSFAGVTNLCARLNVLESSALLARCHVLLTNDSAAMHISAAMGTPSVVILGPTVREFGFVPPEPITKTIEVSGLWCRPCTPFGGSRCPTDTYDCMEKIGVAEVLQAVLDRLEESHVH